MITNDSEKRSILGDELENNSNDRGKGKVPVYEQDGFRRKKKRLVYNNNSQFSETIKDVGFDNEHYIPLIDYLNLPKLTRAFSSPSVINSPDDNILLDSYFDKKKSKGGSILRIEENAINDDDDDDETETETETETVNEFVRTYSDGDRDRFNYETGKRHDIETNESVINKSIYDNNYNQQEGFFLPYSLLKKDQYLRIKGLEDEYIPDFSFKDSLKLYLDDMNFDSEGNAIIKDDSNSIDEEYGLHSEVKPMKIKDDDKIEINKVEINNNNDDKSNSLIFDETIFKIAKSPERQGDKLYLSNIPNNFSSMSFSERYKLLNDILPDSLRQDSKYKNHLTKLIRASSSISLNTNNSNSNTASSSPAFEYLYGGGSNNTSRRNSAMIENNINEKGSIVMGYKLGNIIGSGAWGVIRSVELITPNLLSSSYNTNNNNSNTNEQNTKAMKIIKTSDSLTIKNRFLQEIKIWKLLKHENILPLLDYIETKDYIFALTYRIKGGTLFDLVRFWGKLKDYLPKNENSVYKNKPIVSLKDRLRRSKRYIKDIVKGLKYMHDSNIIHGDIKLENCLIDIINEGEFNKILICDFGMSRLVNSSTSSLLTFSSSSSSSLSSSSSNSSSSLLLLSSSSLYHQQQSNQIKKLLIDPNHNLGPSPTSITFHPSNSTTSLNSSSTTSLNQNQMQFVSNSPLSFHARYNNNNNNNNSSNKQFQKPLQLTKAWGLSQPLSNPENKNKNKNKNNNNNDNDNKNNNIDSTAPDTHIGSLPYSPPEILLPNPPDLNIKTDIWSFGVLLYSLIFGHLPFMHKFEPRLRLIIINGGFQMDELNELIELSEKNKNNDNDNDNDEVYDDLIMFKKLINGCLEKKIEKRFTCDDILRYL